tara:strand:+ start:154 stop:381 length:228 start_codon:yes stop_codon:yes gene_type:complete
MSKFYEIKKHFEDLEVQVNKFERVLYSSDCEIHQAKMLRSSVLLVNCSTQVYFDNLNNLIKKLEKKEETISKLQK